MIAVVQRVQQATVTVDGEVVGSTGRGLCVLLGIERDDEPANARLMAARLAKLRIFPDEPFSAGAGASASASGKMNRSVVDIAGGILLVSQFTLAGDTSAGNRPSFTNAAPPAAAEPLYELVRDVLGTEYALPVGTGRFRATMSVAIVNDGPVTLILRA
ncbi:MAG: D-aminoacyl-tRNA deacylase [Phycisphaerae bacterium]|nr:D-aminoacyl-tRNA deacylase [Phycisphaerae bacterium]